MKIYLARNNAGRMWYSLSKRELRENLPPGRVIYSDDLITRLESMQAQLDATFDRVPIPELNDR